MLISGLLIRTIFNTNFITPPIANAIAGICTFPNPYSPPSTTQFSDTNIIVIVLKTNILDPFEAAGQISFRIGSASATKPAAHGIINKIEAKNENDNLLFTVA